MPQSIQETKVAFIGGGNMASAIISGLVAKGTPKSSIIVSEPWDVNRQKLDAQSIPTTTNNIEAAQGADVVILAVKPQVTKQVCEAFGAAWSGDARPKLPIVVSVAAGVTLQSIAQWSTTKDGRMPHAIRVMPNTPALVGEGASGLYAGPDVTKEEKDLVTALMSSVSRATEWVSEEGLLDVVTAISGSGPAYFFNFVEHLVSSATALGLPLEQATRLASQTCLGAGKMLVESSESPSQLRTNVTSPNGTTHAALESLKSSGLEKVVDDAVKAASNRSVALSKL